jgi:hypothetical protein
MGRNGADMGFRQIPPVTGRVVSGRPPLLKEGMRCEFDLGPAALSAETRF